jgi:hypothetical protein
MRAIPPLFQNHFKAENIVKMLSVVSLLLFTFLSQHEVGVHTKISKETVPNP